MFLSRFYWFDEKFNGMKENFEFHDFLKSFFLVDISDQINYIMLGIYLVLVRL